MLLYLLILCFFGVFKGHKDFMNATERALVVSLLYCFSLNDKLYYESFYEKTIMCQVLN